jgi:CRISPR-associated protein Cmr3
MRTAKDYRADEPLSPCAILTIEERGAEVLSEWVSFPSLLRMLSFGKIDEKIFDEALFFSPVAHPREDWVKEEPRTGHHRDGSGSVAKEGGLFTRTALRFKEEIGINGLTGSGYAGLVEIPEELHGALQNLGWVRLGGDGHRAACEVKDPAAIPGPVRKELARAIAAAKGIVLYLATPAIFTKGWQPEWGRFLPGWTLKAAAVGRPLPIAGWDYAKQAPRPVYRAVPPGSVYFLQAPQDFAGDDSSQIVDRFLLKESLSDRYGRLGFGYTIVGAWDPDGPPSGAGKEVYL